MGHVLFVLGASRSRGPPGQGQEQGWKWAFEPRQVTHPLSTSWCTGRFWCSCFGMFLLLALEKDHLPRYARKMPGCKGCGEAMWASVSPKCHGRVFSQLIRWSVASQNLASRLFLFAPCWILACLCGSRDSQSRTHLCNTPRGK